MGRSSISLPREKRRRRREIDGILGVRNKENV